MKVELKMIVVLTAVALISGMVLGFTHTKTKPKIDENLRLAVERALKAVIPETYSYEKKVIDRHTTAFIAKDSTDQLVGYGVMIEGSGFQGPIKLMVGFTKDGEKLTGIEVIENVETPGLGNRIVEDWFKEQFKERVIPIKVVKGRSPENEHEIQAITGATISSKSVVRIVNEAHDKLLQSGYIQLEPNKKKQTDSSDTISSATLTG